MADPHTARSSQRMRIPYLYYAVLIYIGLICYFLFQGGKTSFMLLTMATLLGCYWLSCAFGGIRRASGIREVGGEGRKHYMSHSHIPVKLQIRIPGWVPMPYLVVHDELYRFGERVHVHESIVTLDHQRSALVTYQTPPLTRGCYQFSHTVCWTKDLFGLFAYEGAFHAEQSLYVMPQTVPVQSSKQLKSWRGAFQVEQSMSRQRRESTTLNGIRDYMQGDKLSRIHWNATAKTGALKSKQFEPEGLPQLVLVLDLSIDAYEDNDRFELAVSILASLAAYSRQQQRRVVIVGIHSGMNLWDAETVRYETLALRQWFASVHPSRVSARERMESSWVNRWATHPELRNGGIVAWISGGRHRSQLTNIAALAKRGWQGDYIHVHTKPSDEDYELRTMLMRHQYAYIPVSELQQLPVRLGESSA
ncbi:DUF58 domain-containing protein [Paenibacillus sp. ACRRX]|uniref:DUF58 domain-containing protein n=1 Tax=Paenibacillus sp. ACRRX TaxID=2918206 RepID=UPI001EF744DD|nr:DUF58 domain-containing protein [Paenibacillus sp. ACRRX]MCG7407906.1 DUF58 domain-containing protein [Paenibacillus sp. ACRRX]